MGLDARLVYSALVCLFRFFSFSFAAGKIRCSFFRDLKET